MPVYVRWKKDEPRVITTLPHLPMGNPASWDLCALCDGGLGNTLPVVLFALGPDDERNRVRHAEGRWYSARALVLHAECVEGTSPEDATVKDVPDAPEIQANLDKVRAAQEESTRVH
jgi:hypothetical protein